MMMAQVKMPSQAMQPAQATGCTAACAPAGCASGACQQACSQPTMTEPKAGGDDMLAELKRLIDRDAQALKSTTNEVLQEHVESSQTVVNSAIRADEASEAFSDQQPAPKATLTAPNSTDPSPGEVKCHRVLVDFHCKSRQCGEMPVKAGEEVMVRYPPNQDWIFGWKGWPVQDQGWLPAQNLGIGVSLEDEGEDEVVQAPCPEKPKEEVEAWHHHGNWWSRQRHLKVDQGSAKKDIGDVRRRPPTDPAELQQSRLASNAFAAATSKIQQAPKGAGKGKGAGRGLGSERLHRDRPALAQTLDRLNKPLVVPQAKKG